MKTIYSAVLGISRTQTIEHLAVFAPMQQAQAGEFMCSIVPAQFAVLIATDLMSQIFLQALRDVTCKSCVKVLSE